MGAAVIAVVFVAGLFGAPSIFGHGAAHAGQPPAASAQAGSAAAQGATVASTRAPAATEVASDDIVHP